MSDPSTLPEWVEHCRAQEIGWRDSMRPGAGLGPKVDRAFGAAADWRALHDLCEVILSAPGPDVAIHLRRSAVCIARLAAHLPTAPTGESS